MKYVRKTASFVNRRKHLVRTPLNRSAPSEVTYIAVDYFEASLIYIYTYTYIEKGSLRELLV
jgi:hypothetical protein